MRMWEIREGHSGEHEGDYSDYRRGGKMSRKHDDKALKEAYECGYEDGYEDAMEHLEEEEHLDHRTPSYRARDSRGRYR